MPLVVNSNIAALNAQRNVGINNASLGKSLERLSSGLRINRAADDAAGLAIATKFGAQVRGLNQAVRNANNAISLVQTAEGGVNTLTNILQRLRELAVQASSDDNTPSDRQTLTSEATNLISEFTRVANTSEFNTMPLLDGAFRSKYFQIGANYSQLVTFSIADARGRSIGGRAEYSANVGDGVTGATNANLGAGEIKVNNYDVAATNAADDQYSVLDVSGASATGSTMSTLASGLTMYINSTAISFGTLSNVAASLIAASIVAAINNASITGVTARVVNGSTWLIEGTGGTNLKLAIENNIGSASALTSILNDLGMSATSGMWGSGNATTAVTNYNGESSAIAKAVAINAVKSSSGVGAAAQANSVTGSGAISAVTLSAGEVYINGYDIGAATVTASDGTGALVTAINNQSQNTGVTASTDANGKLVLTAADGRNIAVTTKTAAIATSLNLSGTATNTSYLYRSTLKLYDNDSFTITSATSVIDLTGSAGTSVSAAKDVSTYNVAALAIDTQSHAQSGILTIDAALNDLNEIRAQIGAVQNRFEFTVKNLEIASENMSASESRIKDADFAYEVATFTRNQVMVQAGTAMLAQANQTTQIALQLLK
jgi:flagellin